MVVLDSLLHVYAFNEFPGVRSVSSFFYMLCHVMRTRVTMYIHVCTGTCVPVHLSKYCHIRHSSGRSSSSNARVKLFLPTKHPCSSQKAFLPTFLCVPLATATPAPQLPQFFFQNNLHFIGKIQSFIFIAIILFVFLSFPFFFNMNF